MKPSLDLSSSVPSALKRGLNAVLKGILGFSVSYVTCLVRGHQKYDVNPFYPWCEQYDVDLTVRLHNDDVHTYDEVTHALKLLNFTDALAVTLTTAVDKQGAALLYSTTNPEIVENASDLLFNHNLLFSIVPTEIFKLESSFVALLLWIQNLGGSNAGIRNIMSAMLMLDVHQLPDFTSIIESDENDPESVKNAQNFAPNHIFETENNFPKIIPSLLPDSIHLPTTPFEIHDTTYWSQYLTEYSRPFDNCPPVVFALLMMSHPFLGKAGKNAINSLIIHFQHDSYFKFGFSEIFMLLYPSLYSLFVRFIGTEEGKL